jgi:hypothetical protein
MKRQLIVPCNSSAGHSRVCPLGEPYSPPRFDACVQSKEEGVSTLLDWAW